MNETCTKRSSTCSGCHECAEPGCLVTKPIDKRRITCDIHAEKNLVHRGDCRFKVYWLYNKSKIQYLYCTGIHSHRDPPHHKVWSSATKCIESFVLSRPSMTATDIQINSRIANTCPSLVNTDRLNAIRTRLLQQHFGGKLDTFVLPKVEMNLLKRVQSSYQDQEVQGTKVVLMLMPYLRVLHIDDEGILIHTQSFFQSVVAYKSDYIVVDVKHGANDEKLYHFGIAIYDENIQRSVMVSRTRVDRMNAQSYKMSFMYFLLTLERDCGIDLNEYLKNQLKGVLVDFSTAQATGFVECVTELLGEEAESTAMNLLKGCYVHWMRSCNRIAKIVCRPDRQNAFLTLCGSIRTEPDQKQVLLMFTTIAELYRETVPWVQWWTREQNLRLLCRAFNMGDGWRYQHS